MKQCRDCSARLADTRSVLCPGCRVLAAEKRKALKRGRTRVRYGLSRRPKDPANPLPPHPCLMEGCQTLLVGKSLYCPACLHRRHLVQQRRYRYRVKAMSEDLPPEPVTSLDWLQNFSAWAKSGLSYAEYQKAEWIKSLNQG